MIILFLMLQARVIFVNLFTLRNKESIQFIVHLIQSFTLAHAESHGGVMCSHSAQLTKQCCEFLLTCPNIGQRDGGGCKSLKVIHTRLSFDYIQNYLQSQNFKLDNLYLHFWNQ
jgi:hypothetical protein